MNRVKTRVTATKGYLSGLLSKAPEECSESQYLAEWPIRRFGTTLQCSLVEGWTGKECQGSQSATLSWSVSVRRNLE